MEETFATYALNRLREIIDTELNESGGSRDVFVLLGLSDVVATDLFRDNIVDPATFSFSSAAICFRVASSLIFLAVSAPSVKLFSHSSPSRIVTKDPFSCT